MWLCVNIYTICMYIYQCMYVCICVCTHVHVCHAYIVCHEYIADVKSNNMWLWGFASSTAGMTGGKALAAAGSGCKFAISAMPWWSAVWGGSPEPFPRAPSAAMFASHAFLPATSDIPLTLDFDFGSLRKKNRIFCFGGKKSWLWKN